MPLGVFNPLCAHNDEHIGVGIHCLFLVKGFARTSLLRISKGKVPRFFISINGWSGADFPQKKNLQMKKLSLFLLSLFLCSVGVPILAEDVDLVPAMVVQMADGSKQVVQLDYTAVTDFSVLCSKGSLAVGVPEADLTGVRSITFAMVKEGDITTDLEEVSSLDNATTDKVLLNGRLYIRATMSDGTQVWYDVMGNHSYKQ